MRIGWCWVFVLLLTGESGAGQGVDVGFVTVDSVSIAATYYAPLSSPAPAIILMHMLGRSRESWFDFTDSLTRGGFAVLAFDFRGHGGSLRSPTRTLSMDSFADSDYAAMTNDAAAAVAWLRQRSDILPEKIGILGAGFGANLALTYAATDRGIPAIALISPGESYRGINAERAIKQYVPRPVFIAVAEDDNYSAITVRTLANLSGGSKTLKIYPEGGHGMYLLRNTPGLMADIVTFFTAQLR